MKLKVLLHETDSKEKGKSLMVNGQTTVWCQSSYLQGSQGLLAGNVPLFIYSQKKSKCVESWVYTLRPAPLKEEKG